MLEFEGVSPALKREIGFGSVAVRCVAIAMRLRCDCVAMRCEAVCACVEGRFCWLGFQVSSGGGGAVAWRGVPWPPPI